VLKLALDSFGSFLGMEKGCIILRDRTGETKRYPLFEQEIGEVLLKSGNLVSTGVLSALGFWGIDVLLITRNGYPIAMLKALEDDSHVSTRIAQYRAVENGKGVQVAKAVTKAKIEGQSLLLSKYGLETKPQVIKVIEGVEEKDQKALRNKLLNIEGHHSEFYFKQIFELLPEKLRPTKRKGFQAYDGINNAFNLCYSLLFWKCYRAILKAHLEPYLGFLHYMKPYRPSLICDFEEIYRIFVDDFLLGFCQNLNPGDFVAKSEEWNRKRSKRIFLKGNLTDDMTKRLQTYFMKIVRVPRIRKGERQELETLVNEEAYILAQYLRGERENWVPRVALP
jgi:CRISPR-associated protein Cas1